MAKFFISFAQIALKERETEREKGGKIHQPSVLSRTCLRSLLLLHLLVVAGKGKNIRIFRTAVNKESQNYLWRKRCNGTTFSRRKMFPKKGKLFDSISKNSGFEREIKKELYYKCSCSA